MISIEEGSLVPGKHLNIPQAKHCTLCYYYRFTATTPIYLHKCLYIGKIDRKCQLCSHSHASEICIVMHAENCGGKQLEAVTNAAHFNAKHLEDVTNHAYFGRKQLKLWCVLQFVRKHAT